ncbi:MAG TPA: hypothetical protein VHB21_23890, partial [Minicystis sp.]|nr:hypothetical protein [Minicystis sp.]
MAPATTGSEYCCYGCELAAEIAAEGAEQGVRVRATMTFCLLLSMLVMMLSLFLFAEDVYPDDGSMEWMRTGYRVAAVALATPVVVLLGAPVLRRAVAALFAGRPTMELLVGAGAIS